jgi:hypothetical protein
MKKILSILTLSLVLWSCQKDNVNPIVQEREFVGGVVEDPTEKAPTKDFMLHGLHKSIIPDNAVAATDVTSPVCDIITPTPGQYMPNGPSSWTITITASDEVGGSGIKRTDMRVYNDGYEYILPNTTPTQTSWTYTPLSFQYNPYSVLLLYVYDNAGNIGVRSIGVYRTQNLAWTPLPSGFPTSFSLACPPIIDQGQEQSTVSIATGYYQLGITKYYKLNSTAWSNSTNVTSPEYLYNIVHVGGTTCGGSSLTNNYNYLSANGTTFWSTLPYSNTNGCSSSTFTNAMRNDALRNKIVGYTGREMVYTLDRGAVKIALNNKKALVFVARMESTAYNSGPGFIWSQADGTSLGSTALTIVGFDDTKQAYKCATTWGPKRCDNGFLWVSYDHMTRAALQVWYISL